jgi:hypothetical protein
MSQKAAARFINGLGGATFNAVLLEKFGTDPDDQRKVSFNSDGRRD